MRNITILLAVAAVVVLAGQAQGDTLRWTGGTATWHADGNWEKWEDPNWVAGHIPVGGYPDGDFVTVNGGTATISADAGARTFYVGDGATGTITQTGGTFDSQEYTASCVGKNGGSGTYNLEGGTHQVDEMYLAYFGGGTGVYNVSQDTATPTALTGKSVYLSHGTFTQTGGSVSPYSTLYIGFGYGSNTYTISGGSLSAYIRMGSDNSNASDSNILNINGGTALTLSGLIVSKSYTPLPSIASHGEVNINDASVPIEMKGTLWLRGTRAYFNAVADSTINMTKNSSNVAAKFDIGEGTTDKSPDPANLSGLNNLTLIF
ncbi:MAG: hypothetical protein KAV00_06590, partial [Phycisphaerae bacterium]|nr:hypothetical protein [Phycisphaerae bacterium]